MGCPLHFKSWAAFCTVNFLLFAPEPHQATLSPQHAQQNSRRLMFTLLLLHPLQPLRAPLEHFHAERVLSLALSFSLAPPPPLFLLRLGTAELLFTQDIRPCCALSVESDSFSCVPRRLPRRRPRRWLLTTEPARRADTPSIRSFTSMVCVGLARRPPLEHSTSPAPST